MTRPHHKLFTALVLQGALLGACYEDDDDSPSDESATDSDATGGDTDTTAGDTDATGTCAEAECANTDVWSECTADGVLCCWATGECCDPCCGHLDP